MRLFCDFRNEIILRHYNQLVCVFIDGNGGLVNSLTPKQEKFCQKYIELGNASEAYRQAYDAENMGDESIRVEAHRLLNDNPNIALHIQQLKDKLVKKHNITVERVLKEYGRLAFLDIRKAFDENGNLKPIHELDDDTAAAIAGLEAEELYEGRGEDREHTGRLRKIKLSDKKGALDSLGKHLGMFVERHEHTGKDGAPIEIKDTTDLARRMAFILAQAATMPKEPK